MTLSPVTALSGTCKEYGTQRPITCDGGLRAEDDRNVEHAALETYLRNDGMTVSHHALHRQELRRPPQRQPMVEDVLGVLAPAQRLSVRRLGQPHGLRDIVRQERVG